MPLLTACSIFITVIKGYLIRVLWYHQVNTGSSGGGGVGMLVVVMNQKVAVSTRSKNFAILEMSPMPALNIFDGDDGRTKEIGLGVPGDVGGGVKSGSWLS